MCVCVGGVVSGEKRSRCTIASLHSSRLFASRFRVVCAVPPGSQLQKNRRVVAWPKPRHGGSFKEIKWNLKKTRISFPFLNEEKCFPEKICVWKTWHGHLFIFFYLSPKMEESFTILCVHPPLLIVERGNFFVLFQKLLKLFCIFCGPVDLMDARISQTCTIRYRIVPRERPSPDRPTFLSFFPRLNRLVVCGGGGGRK